MKNFLNRNSSFIIRYSIVRRGFTLIELLVVIALLGIIATSAAILLNPGGQIQKSRDSQRKSDLAQLQRVIEQYYNDVGAYPQQSGGSAPANYNIQDKAGVTYTWNSPWYGYMNLLPKDPLSTQRYVYVSPCGGGIAGQSYCIYAHLERGAADSQACTGGNDCTNRPAANVCGNGTTLSCNYGVGSSNVTP